MRVCDRPIRALLALALLAAVGAPPARAEHRVYYRYTVLGYVRDTTGKPRVGQTVELTRDKTGFSYQGHTDDAGLFAIVARLGDESVGESLTLRHDDTRISLVARFDAANHTDERGTRVDLEGTRVTERPTLFRATLARLLTEPPR